MCGVGADRQAENIITSLKMCCQCLQHHSTFCDSSTRGVGVGGQQLEMEDRQQKARQLKEAKAVVTDCIQRQTCAEECRSDREGSLRSDPLLHSSLLSALTPCEEEEDDDRRAEMSAL